MRHEYLSIAHISVVQIAIKKVDHSISKVKLHRGTPIIVQQFSHSLTAVTAFFNYYCYCYCYYYYYYYYIYVGDPY